MDALKRIESLLRSLCPLFYVGSPDQKLVVAECVETAQRQSMEVFGYNIGEGLWRPGDEKVKDGNIDPIEMFHRILSLKHTPRLTKRKLYILEHFDLLIENEDPLVLTMLRLVNDADCHWYSVILMGPPFLQLPGIIEDIPKVYASSLGTKNIRKMLTSAHP